MASDASPFAKLMPGFEFLQGLVKNAGAATPGIGQWVAPTLNPEEIQKRIDELKTVQFWLEQNARMIGATVQALEVQRMTLSTLKTMNVRMSDLRDALTVHMPGNAAAKAAPAAQPAQPTAPAPQKPIFSMPSMASPIAAAPAAPAGAAPPGGGGRAATQPEGAATPGSGAVDPMQWWGALTKQFTELAATALRDTAAAVKPPFAAGASAKPAAGAAGAGRPAVAAKKSAPVRKTAPRRDGAA